MIKNRRKFRPRGSNKTTPITKEQFDFILNEFSDRNDIRMQIICHLMYRAIRIGDILNTIRIQNVFEHNGTLRDRIEFREEKTEKLRTVPIRGEKFISALNKYYPSIKTFQKDSSLFYTEKTGEPLQDSGVKKLLRYFVGKRNITQCSPHSFRKGGARFMFENNVRIENISDVLNHHSTRVTELYISITPRDIEKSMACLEI